MLKTKLPLTKKNKKQHSANYTTTTAGSMSVFRTAGANRGMPIYNNCPEKIMPLYLVSNDSNRRVSPFKTYISFFLVDFVLYHLTASDIFL